MNFLSTGKVSFDDIYEMYYHLFTEMGLGINAQQYLYDQDTGITLKFKDKYIKATVQPIPIYAGRNDIVFEPVKNYSLVVSLLGYFLDKEAAEENQIGYIAQYIDENQELEVQRVVIKTHRGDLASQFYHNLWLAYIEIIFILSGNFDPDLSNFDIIYE